MSNDQYKSASDVPPRLSDDPVVRLAECRSERNQCDGCQAGIPLINGAHHMGKPGGYSDKMSCAAHLYAKATILQDANVRHAGNISSLTIISQKTQEKQAVPSFDEEAERVKFETWVYSTPHIPYGWLGQEWLARKGASYASDYVHGLWVGYCAKSRAEGK